MTAKLAYLTANLPGIGGVIKQRPEDFLVEEQPRYQPSGQGEHLYLFIEKRLLATMDVVRRLARAFRVGKRDIGFAGLKDKHAVTRQMFSIMLPGQSHDPDCIERLESDHLKVLWVDRHENKLRRGHLLGNRFVIRIRQVDPSTVVQAKRVMDQLAVSGVANYIGSQRFGYRQHNHELGRLLLLGQWKPMLDLMLGGPKESDPDRSRAAREAYDRGDYAGALALWPGSLRDDRHALDRLRQGKTQQQAVMSLDARQGEFLISGLQSAAFNRVLDQRVRDGLLDQVVVGDLAWKHDNRAVFPVDEATAQVENASAGRINVQEVSPSGPMWGVEMIRAGGQVGVWEHRALTETGLAEADLAGGPQGTAKGSRRPLRIFLSGLDLSGGVDEHGSYVRVAFELPRGSFATTVLREVLKPANDPDVLR